jgi:hypothetical protein
VTAPAEVAYCTREQVQASLDQSDAPRLNSRIDECCQSGSRDVEGRLHRRFYPTLGVRYPEPYQVSGGVLWLNTIDLEVISLTSVVVDGTTMVVGTDYYLDGDSAPYTALRLYSGASRQWSASPRGNVLTGEFGGQCTSAAAGALAAAITDAAATAATVTNSGLVGVGDLLKVGTERMLVTEKRSATTTATIAGTVDADDADTTVVVSSGALVQAGETILVDSERMYVEDVTGNTLTVARAQHGSVLAAHAIAATVYAPRLLTIVRGMAGTTATTHLTAAAVTRNVAPSLVSEAAMALAINTLEQGKAAYSRTAGAGDHRRSTGGAGVAAAILAQQDAAYAAYGRKGRIGATS